MWNVILNNVLKEHSKTNTLIKVYVFSCQDGSVGKCGTQILAQPRQNYNYTTEQPSCRANWNLAEQKSYN